MAKKKLVPVETQSSAKEETAAVQIPKLTEAQNEFLRVVHELALEHVDKIHTDVKSFVHMSFDGKTYGFSTKNLSNKQLAAAHEKAAKDLIKSGLEREKNEKKFRAEVEKVRKSMLKEAKNRKSKVDLE
jgi:hypothetical protein